MGDEVSRSQLWSLARKVVERTAPIRARMDDPKDPRFTGVERDAAAEALRRSGTTPRWSSATPPWRARTAPLVLGRVRTCPACSGAGVVIDPAEPES